MESLLYVVLYCALLWLPHNLPDDEVSETYTRFFEFSTIHSGADVGGDAKAANAYNRRYTRNIVFDCTAVKTWLDTVMDFCSPRDPSEKGKWTPSHVDAFWSNFLDTETLDRHGRVAHHIRRKQPQEAVSSDEDEETESSTDSSESIAQSVAHPSTSLYLHDPSPATESSPSLTCTTVPPDKCQPALAGPAVKRTTRTSAAADTAPRPKRARMTHTTTSHRGPSDPTSLRRSQHIYDQQHRSPVEDRDPTPRSSGRTSRVKTPSSGTRGVQSARPTRGRGRGRGIGRSRGRGVAPQR